MKISLILAVVFSTLVAAFPADKESQDGSHEVVENKISNSSVSVGDPGAFSITRKNNFIQERLRWAEENLEELFQQFTSFTQFQLFSFLGFESQAASLEARMNEIALTVENLDNLEPETGLLVQFRFAQIVYNDMLSALSLYKAFPIKGTQGHEILRNLVQMNVCLFTLRDHKGKPDPSIKNYIPSIRSTIYDLDNTMSVYGKQGKTSSNLDSVIKIQLKKLWNTISELKRASLELSKEL